MKTLMPFVVLALVTACGSVPLVDTAAEPAAASADVTQPAGLSADERVIWNSMTPEARRQAVEFIANGGTFAQFVAV